MNYDYIKIRNLIINSLKYTDVKCVNIINDYEEHRFVNANSSEWIGWGKKLIFFNRILPKEYDEVAYVYLLDLKNWH